MSEKRAFARNLIRMPALYTLYRTPLGTLPDLEEEIEVRGLAESIDVSLIGVCLKLQDVHDKHKDRLDKEHGNALLRCPITIDFSTTGLTLWGSIAWVSPDKRQVGVVITNTSDQDLWQVITESSTL